MTLVILNLKSPHMRPWVLLTDLCKVFKFFWMDGSTIYCYEGDAPKAWNIMMDLLQHDANVTFAEPGEQAVASVPILARKEISAELKVPRAVRSDVGNLSDVMDEDEVRAYHMLQQLSVQPALAPYMPYRSIPANMYG